MLGTELWSCYARRMSTLGLVEYADATLEVRAVYDDIMATRNTDWINNFWKALAHDPVTLRRTWQSVKEIMAPGALDALTKEMICRGEREQPVRVLHRLPHRRRPQGGNDGPDVRGVDGRGGDGERNQPPGQRVPGGSGREVHDCLRERAGHPASQRQVARPLAGRVEAGRRY